MIKPIKLLIALMLMSGFEVSAYKPAEGYMMTTWGENIDPENVLPEYPRPIMERPEWQNLNGLWDYAIVDKNVTTPAEYQGEILVPFCAESSLSGVAKEIGGDKAIWYKRTFAVPKSWQGRDAAKRDIVFVNSDVYRQKQEQNSSQQQQVRDSWHNPDGSVKRLEHWCKLPLNEQQQADYLAGKKVLVGETKDKFGNDCTVYFQYNPEKRQPETTRVYPDRDKVVGIAEESKTQMAVNNDGSTNEATKNVKEPLQRGQTAPKDENQQRQQRKPKGPKP